MATTPAERSKAKYIRGRGAQMTPAQKDWLADYESRIGRVSPSHEAAPARDYVPALPAPQEHAPPVQEHSPPPASEGDAPWAGFAQRPSTPSAPPATSIALPGAMCPGGKDCPECRKLKGAMTCSATGKPVYPRMTDEAAKGMAGMLLGVIAFAARFVWKKDVTPTEAEISTLGKSLQETIYQRASWAGADGDLFALAFVLISFGARVKNAPEVKP